MTIHDLPKLSKDKMETLFQRSKRRSFYFLIFSFSFIAFCAWQYFTTSNSSFRLSLLIFFSIAMGIWLFITAGQILLTRLISVPLSKVKEKKLGKYSGEDVQMLLEKVFSKSLINEKPQVYIANIDIAFAMAADIYLFNFIKPFNAIYISKGSFCNLSLDEIEALILHEMAHFNHYMYHEAKKLTFIVWHSSHCKQPHLLP